MEEKEEVGAKEEEVVAEVGVVVILVRVDCHHSIAIPGTMRSKW